MELTKEQLDAIRKAKDLGIDAWDHWLDTIAARDADLWRMAQEKMRLKAAKSGCRCRCHEGMQVTCTCGGGWECEYGKIMALPLDPLPNGDNHE